MLTEEEYRGAWCAAIKDEHQWIQVDLGLLLKVTGVIIQGRQDLDQWVTSYEVLHSVDGDKFETVMNSTDQLAVKCKYFCLATFNS